MYDLASPPPWHSAGSDWVAGHCRSRESQSNVAAAYVGGQGGWMGTRDANVDVKMCKKAGFSPYRPCLSASSTIAEVVGRHTSSEAVEVNIEVRGGRQMLGGIRFKLISFWPSSKPQTHPEMQCVPTVKQNRKMATEKQNKLITTEH